MENQPNRYLRPLHIGGVPFGQEVVNGKVYDTFTRGCIEKRLSNTYLPPKDGTTQLTPEQQIRIAEQQAADNGEITPMQKAAIQSMRIDFFTRCSEQKLTPACVAQHFDAETAQAYDQWQKGQTAENQPLMLECGGFTPLGTRLDGELPYPTDITIAPTTPAEREAFNDWYTAAQQSAA